MPYQFAAVDITGVPDPAIVLVADSRTTEAEVLEAFRAAKHESSKSEDGCPLIVSFKKDPA